MTRTVVRRECAPTDEPRALYLAFSRHGGIYRSDVVSKAIQRWGRVLPPVGQTRSPVKARDGSNDVLCSSSAMSSGRLFLDRVARQQSPSPLHRHEQSNTHSATNPAKGDISTLPATGRFYFALARFNSCSMKEWPLR
jgi:hypothetical protein